MCHVTYNRALHLHSTDRERGSLMHFPFFFCIFSFSNSIFSIYGGLLCVESLYCVPRLRPLTSQFPPRRALVYRIEKYIYKNDSARSLLDDSVPCLPCNGISEFPTAAAAAVADWRLLYPHTHTHTQQRSNVVDQHKSAYYHHKRLVHSDEIISLLLLLLLLPY